MTVRRWNWWCGNYGEGGAEQEGGGCEKVSDGVL